MFQDRFEDASGDGVTAEVIDNADGEHLVVNVFGAGGEAVGILLTADDAQAMAEALLTLAAGL